MNAYDAPVADYVKPQKLAEAESWLARGLAVDRDRHLYAQLGWVCIARGDTTGAPAAIDQALAIDPTNVYAKARRDDLRR